MAICSFKSFLHLLLILHQSYFFSAQVLDYTTAKVSTLWTNNNLSIINVTRPYDYTNSGFSDTPGPFMRIILLKEINHQQGFAFGFLSNGTDDSFILAIGIVKPRRDYISEHIQYFWTDLELVWFANRNKPVRENGTLNFLADGDLVLRDADGALVWSTNTSNMFVAGMKMTGTGNLVVYDNHNRTVWQSFDHLADTLLNGQKLIAGQKLVARVSATNWAEGSYDLSVTSHGLFAFYQPDTNTHQMYFKFSVQGTRESLETSYVKSINGTLALYISSTEPSEPDVVFSRPSSVMQFIRLDHDGHLRAYGVEMRAYGEEEMEPVDLLAEFLSECDYPSVCGNFGLCSGGRCSCPAGFSQANISNSINGCLEISPTTCSGPNSHGLQQLTDVFYFTYVDTDAAVIKGTDLESCKEACLNNCSCKAALFRYFLNVSKGDCFLPSPVLSLINDGKERTIDQSYAFIKISNDMLNSTVSSSSVNRIGIIAGSSVGGFILLVMAIGIWIVFLRKKKSIEGDEDEYLDQVSGMPLRFSFAELKLATGNFQIKLGEGGFGSVFEGRMINGERIAVKRLDGLGQGKKEFLAEIKTIGSIHHVNLVRLIGFCAENLHRLLVYEFMGNGSLDRWIFSRTSVQPPLDWQARKNIILDIAKGLAYLHEECRQRIVHLDIKPQNILLGPNLRAKISDFGLSKFIDKDQSHAVTKMRGTPGYLAPEWLSSCITEKVDVYSFGIVVMEVVTGRKNLDPSQPDEECMHLLSLFMRKIEEDQLVDMVDKNNVDMQLHGVEAVEMMRLAAWCLQPDFSRRPSMSMVVKVIEGTVENEADLDLRLSNPTNMVAVNKGSELGTSATLLPSILSGPR